MVTRFSLVLVALVALAMVLLPASAEKNQIAQGGEVFIGEQGLNVSSFLAGNSSIAYFSSGTNPGTDVPDYQLTVGDATNFYVAPAIFSGRTGTWYSAWGGGGSTVAFIAVDPTIAVWIWDNTVSKDATGKQVVRGDYLNFAIETNTFSVASRPGFDPATDGWVKIKVKTADGATLTALYQDLATSIGLTGQVVDQSYWYWVETSAGKGWNTAVVDTAGSPLYSTGTYIVSADLDPLNGIKDNYRAPDGTDYTGKTVASPNNVTLSTASVAIGANKEALVRGNPFSVTVTGRPNEFYYIWFKGTGGQDDPAAQPPQIAMNQNGVYRDPPCGTGFPASGSPTPPPNPIGDYAYSGGAGRTIAEDVPQTTTPPSCSYYAGIKTSVSGTRTIGFLTGPNTKDQTYTIRVENSFDGQPSSDEVRVTIEKGGVTIVAAGDQSYYLDQEVLLSGTNSETDRVYLFITGPNLPANGGLMTDPMTPVCPTCTPPVFTSASVLDDKTWEYTWQTTGQCSEAGCSDLDAGTYAIYAVATPDDKATLAGKQYSTVSVIIKKPFVTAEASRPVVAQGDKMFIRGIAEGDPSQGVAVWIMGTNYVNYVTQAVNNDGTFDYEIDGGVTSKMSSGTYFVVVQHPMYNDMLDIYPTAADGYPFRYVVLVVPYYILFTLEGPGSLQGSEAAFTLVVFISDSTVDDTFASTQFTVEVPEIRIFPIDQKNVGDTFMINGTTNLEAGDELQVELVSSSFQPTPKEVSGEFSGTAGTVKVVEGNGGINTWSFPVDTITFTPDEYIVTVSAIGLQSQQDVTASQLFSVVEFCCATAPTSPSVTAVETPVPPSTIPILTITPTAPGFGILAALAGLGVIAFFNVRRR
jgi:hypothetical protein